MSNSNDYLDKDALEWMGANLSDKNHDIELTQVGKLTAEIDSLKSLLRSAHEIIYDLHKYEEGDICNEVHESPCGVKVWLSAYSSLTSSKSGMGA